MESNKKKKFVKFTNENIAWGLTAFIVICASILVYLLLTQMPVVLVLWGTMSSVLMPVILGGVMAYILLPIYNFLRTTFAKHLPENINPKWKLKIARALSNVISHVVLIFVVGGMIVLAGPQVFESIIRVIESLPSAIDKLTDWAEMLLADYPPFSRAVVDLLGDFEEKFMDILTNYVLPYVSQIVGGITSGVVSMVNIVFDVLVGIIVSVYLLNVKDNFSGQAKKFVYGVLKTADANKLIENVRDVHGIFSGFITGKIIDSFIIGCITFPVLYIMKMPYAVMVSVVVGVTNIIPFFGPFIGAIPCTLIILTVDPLKALYFAIYAFIIQQIDGNIIGPKILGNSTGIPSIWVLFSILVGGGIFGFVGMVLAVPVFATIYMFMGRFVDSALEKKNLPTLTSDFVDIDQIDPETGNPSWFVRYIKKEKSEKRKVGRKPGGKK